MITLNFIKNKNISSKIPIKYHATDFIPNCGRLNKNNEACRFFGVDKRENIAQKLANHINLIFLKSKDVGFLPSLSKRTFFSIDKPDSIINSHNHIWMHDKGKSFKKLLTMPARLTFDGKFFGENGEAASHTIGILYEPKSKTLFCLDSLSNLCVEVKKYQDILKRQIFNSPHGEIEKIIFSNKPQQNVNEYTCNNWTIANIEALKKALNDGKKINSTQKLNDVLPNDINTILNEQYKYVIENNKEIIDYKYV